MIGRIFAAPWPCTCTSDPPLRPGASSGNGPKTDLRGFAPTHYATLLFPCLVPILSPLHCYLVSFFPVRYFAIRLTHARPPPMDAWSLGAQASKSLPYAAPTYNSKRDVQALCAPSRATSYYPVSLLFSFPSVGVLLHKWPLYDTYRTCSTIRCHIVYNNQRVSSLSKVLGS